MISFKLFGIPIQIEPWFWVTMIFIGGGLRANDALSMMLVGVFVIAGLISILIHELGHALTIKKYGLPTSITLVAFGGFASYPSGQLDRKQSFIVTAAGPGVQFLFGLLMIGLVRTVQFPEGSLLLQLIEYLILVSIIWSILNCLPIFPMDGGQMLAAVLGPSRQKYVFLTGIFVAVAIGILGYLVGMWLLAIFMAFFAWKNWKDFQVQKGL